MQFNYFIPIIIVILSNVLYHITAKSIPQGVNSFLSLAVTYLCGLIIAIFMYCITSKSNNILGDIHELNWASYILGVAVLGVEIGYMYMYRVGWNVSQASLIANILLAVLLIIIGILFYKEQIGMYQIAGMGCCIVGLILVSKH